MIKYIVFDFDGTLADTFETTKEIIKSEFKDATDEDFESFKDEGIRRMMKKKKHSCLGVANNDCKGYFQNEEQRKCTTIS
jgi:phosphoglycolate phosphatase-like HAD superfamily hydrolase